METPRAKKVRSEASAQEREPLPIRVPTARSIHVRIPVDGPGKERLRLNLKKMGLERLLDLPWDIEHPSLFHDLLLNQCAVTSPIRAHVSAWTEKLISKVYRISRSGSGWCDPNEELRDFAETFFEPNRVRKNGWTIDQCLDDVDLRPVFAFLTPILKPEAQSRVTLSLAMTVIASFTQRKEINWAGILREIIVKTAKKLRGSSFTHLAPFVAHMYHTEGCLTETEQLELCSLFPGEYHVGNTVTRGTAGVESRPQSPQAAPSTSSLTDSQLLQKVLDFLVCSREDLFDEVKRLRFADLTSRHASPSPSTSPQIHLFEEEFVDVSVPPVSSTVQPESEPVEVVPDIYSTASPYQPDESYSPTALSSERSPPLGSDIPQFTQQPMPETMPPEETLTPISPALVEPCPTTLTTTEELVHEQVVSSPPRVVPTAEERGKAPATEEPKEKSPASAPDSPVFVLAEPLAAKAPGAMDLREMDPVAMCYEYFKAIEELAYRFAVVVDPVPRVIQRGRALPFLSTYAYLSPGDRVPLLPIDPRRRDTLDAVDIWNWVYHCRLVVAPCLAYHVDCPWPSTYTAWVGPDGVPIRKDSDDLVLQHRTLLLKYQKVKGKASKARKQISWLVTLPLIQPYPVALRLPLR